MGTAIYMMVQAALREMGENGYDDIDVEWEPLSRIFGGGVVPKESGDVIQDAINTAIDKGQCSKETKWLFLELLCRRYLDENDMKAVKK